MRLMQRFERAFQSELVIVDYGFRVRIAGHVGLTGCGLLRSAWKPADLRQAVETNWCSVNGGLIGGWHAVKGRGELRGSRRTIFIVVTPVAFAGRSSSHLPAAAFLASSLSSKCERPKNAL
jgi:hypothetical protein